MTGEFQSHGPDLAARVEARLAHEAGELAQEQQFGQHEPVFEGLLPRFPQRNLPAEAVAARTWGTPEYAAARQDQEQVTYSGLLVDVEHDLL